MAQIAVRVFDQVPGAPRVARPTLVLASERLSVRDLIAQRLEHDARETGRTSPSPIGFAEEKSGDVGAQLTAAWRAFAAGRFLLLVDEHQVEALDELVVLTAQSEVTFIKLMPLVGG